MLKRKSYFLVFLLIFILLYSLGTQVFKTTDAQRHAILAVNMLEGRGYALGGFPEIVFPPGYSLLLTPLLLVGFSAQQAVTALSSLSASLIVAMSFLILRKKYSVATSFLLSFFVLVNGHFLLWTALGHTEIVWVATMLIALYFFVDNKYAASGLVIGVAYLVKPETLAYAAFGLVFVLLKSKNRKDLAKYLLPLLVVIASYSSYLFSNTGQLALSGKIPTLEWSSFIENPETAREEVVHRLNPDGSVGPNLGNYSLKNVNLIKRASLNALALKQSLFEIFLPLKVFAVLALGIFVVFAKHRKKMIGEAMIVSPALVAILFQIENRYLILILGIGIFWLVRAATTGAKTRLGMSISAASFVFLLALTFYSYLPLKAELPDLKKQLLTFDSQSQDISEVELIISRKPYYSFF